MKKEGKKYRRNWVAAVCYGLAAAMLIYVCYQVGSTVKQINEYYAQYGMSAQPIEYITYCLQTAMEPLFYTITFFMFGYILDEVRKNNKAYYLTDEEVVELAAAKKEAREAKKFAKGEKAAAKAGYVAPAENSVEADFAKSLDEELKADEKKAAAKAEGKPENKGENRKPRSNSYNRSNQNRQGSKPNPNRNRSEGENKGGNGGSKSGGNKGGGQRRTSSKKPADKPKTEDSAKPKADDGFEVVINEADNK